MRYDFFFGFVFVKYRTIMESCHSLLISLLHAFNFCYLQLYSRISSDWYQEGKSLNKSKTCPKIRPKHSHFVSLFIFCKRQRKSAFISTPQLIVFICSHNKHRCSEIASLLLLTLLTFIMSLFFIFKVKEFVPILSNDDFYSWMGFYFFVAAHGTNPEIAR